MTLCWPTPEARPPHAAPVWIVAARRDGYNPLTKSNETRSAPGTKRPGEDYASERENSGEIIMNQSTEPEQPAEQSHNLVAELQRLIAATRDLVTLSRGLLVRLDGLRRASGSNGPHPPA